MYVDLKYTTSRKMPIGYEFIGAVVTDTNLRGVLVRDETRAREYFVMVGNTLDRITDQEGVAQAVQQAREALVVLPDVPVFADAVAPSPKKMMGVNLDEWTVRTLRAYGNGNLSAGIRQAAKLLVGVC